MLAASAAVPHFKAPILDYHALAPEIVLTSVLGLLLLVDLVVGARERWATSTIYGYTGTTLRSVTGKSIAVSPVGHPILSFSIFLVLVGFAFKVSAVPFHQWAPDAYEGAPTPVTAFLSVASKTGGMVAILELVYVGFLNRHDVWAPLFWVLAALTMTVGNW